MELALSKSSLWNQMTKDRRKRYHFAWDTRKPNDGFRDASGVLSPAFHFREADLGLFHHHSDTLLQS
jgi:hypothetical protein